MNKTTLNFAAFVIALMLALLFVSASAFCQDIPAGDAAAIRRLIAENQSLKDANAELRAQVETQKGFASQWKDLFLAEKDRADRLLSGEVEQLRTAIAAEKESVRLLREQHTNDAQYIETLERRVSSLKSQRLWFGAVGFGLGTAIGTRIQF